MKNWQVPPQYTDSHLYNPGIVLQYIYTHTLKHNIYIKDLLFVRGATHLEIVWDSDTITGMG